MSEKFTLKITTNCLTTKLRWIKFQALISTGMCRNYTKCVEITHCVSKLDTLITFTVREKNQPWAEKITPAPLVVLVIKAGPWLVGAWSLCDLRLILGWSLVDQPQLYPHHQCPHLVGLQSCRTVRFFPDQNKLLSSHHTCITAQTCTLLHSTVFVFVFVFAQLQT